jgi:imidazoleglycerol-phosphate dehydratase / histidinol-phosphatase
MQLAANIGSKGIWLNNDSVLGQNEIINNNVDTLIKNTVVLSTVHWQSIYQFLKLPPRIFSHRRITKETQIQIAINLDGTGVANISTGLPFFNHMLEQIARHANIDITIQTVGDLYIDEHHTIEDTAIALGEIFLQALGNKKGIERYGFTLPMDDCLATVAIDFGGRCWIVWEANFKREKIGDMPTEMFFHFFKSFSDGAKCNVNIKADGVNEHHKIESIFKAFAKAIKMAIAIDINNNQLPTTKEFL